MSNSLSNMSEAMAPKKGEARQWIRRAAIVFLLALALSALLMGLLWRLQVYLRQPLEEYALYAYVAVFLVAMLSSATVLLPAPGLAFMLAVAAHFNPAWVALAASMGDTLGELTGYSVGYWGGRPLVRRYPSIYHQAEGWMRRYGPVTVSVIAFLPLMIFDLVGIAAGVLRFPLWKFMLACWAGRLPRAFINAFFGAGFFKLLMSLFG